MTLWILRIFIARACAQYERSPYLRVATDRCCFGLTKSVEAFK
jgi:hypothetical protein